MSAISSVSLGDFGEAVGGNEERGPTVVSDDPYEIYKSSWF